jgi:hypothetical protein
MPRHRGKLFQGGEGRRKAHGYIVVVDESRRACMGALGGLLRAGCGTVHSPISRFFLLDGGGYVWRRCAQGLNQRAG